MTDRFALQPENLLLANDSIDSPVLLADFGLSKIVDPESPLNVPVGTPGYVGTILVAIRFYLIQ